MTKDWEAAVLGGSIADLERLRLAGADLDARDDHGQTALMLAACRGDLGVVAWLVDRCADLDVTAKYGLSAIMLAAIGGHADVVRLIADSGASLTLQGSGAPAFAGKTALDLAIARGDQASVSAIEAAASRRRVAEAHFLSAPSFEAASTYLMFAPAVPGYTAGLSLTSIRIHIRDHKDRDLPPERRTLEAHYRRFVLSQSRPGSEEARRLALDVRYGRVPQDVRIAGCAGRVYDLGLEPPPGDIDGRSPAVVTWHDRDLFYLVASSKLPSEELIRIAESLYR